MHRCTCWLAALALGALGMAQGPAAGALSIDTDARGFAGFVATAGARLLAAQRRDGAVVATPLAAADLDDQTGAVLALLRLGHWQQARAVLEFEFACIRRRGAVTASLPRLADDPEPAPLGPARDWDRLEVPGGGTAAMLVLQHYWYLRATRDTALIRRHWPLLEACVKRTPRQHGVLTRADSDGAFALADAAVLLQAVFCLGGMQDQIDRIEHPERWRLRPPQPRPGAGYCGSALRLLQQFERQFWVDDAGRFATALRPASLWPEPAPQPVAGLLPAWAGMLTTTGDKTVRHAQAMLSALRLRDDHAAAELAVMLTALTQFEGAERVPTLAELLRCDIAALRLGDVGRAVDAALFAVSGLRCAASPGVDEDWLRWRPELPPGAHRLALRCVAHGAFAGDLCIDDQAGSLHCVLTARTVATADDTLLAVLQCRGQQVQARLAAGDTFAHTARPGAPLPALLAAPR